jgi:hypothetical protein
MCLCLGDYIVHDQEPVCLGVDYTFATHGETGELGFPLGECVDVVTGGIVPDLQVPTTVQGHCEVLKTLFFGERKNVTYARHWVDLTPD